MTRFNDGDKVLLGKAMDARREGALIEDAIKRALSDVPKGDHRHYLWNEFTRILKRMKLKKVATEKQRVAAVVTAPTVPPFTRLSSIVKNARYFGIKDAD